MARRVDGVPAQDSRPRCVRRVRPIRLRGYFPEAEDAQPSDVERAEYIADLVEDGYTDQLLLSQGIFLKYLLRKYGGHGYAHILSTVLPMFEGAGVPDDAVEQVLASNPQRMLIFAEPE